MDIFTHRGKNIEKERKSKQKLLKTAFAVDFFSAIKLVWLLFGCVCSYFFFNYLGVHLIPTYAQISL